MPPSLPPSPRRRWRVPKAASDGSAHQRVKDARPMHSNARKAIWARAGTRAAASPRKPGLRRSLTSGRSRSRIRLSWRLLHSAAFLSALVWLGRDEPPTSPPERRSMHTTEGRSQRLPQRHSSRHVAYRLRPRQPSIQVSMHRQLIAYSSAVLLDDCLHRNQILSMKSQQTTIAIALPQHLSQIVDGCCTLLAHRALFADATPYDAVHRVDEILCQFEIA